jgi:hypothetical protein
MISEDIMKDELNDIIDVEEEKPLKQRNAAHQAAFLLEDEVLFKLFEIIPSVIILPLLSWNYCLYNIPMFSNFFIFYSE